MKDTRFAAMDQGNQVCQLFHLLLFLLLLLGLLHGHQGLLLLTKLLLGLIGLAEETSAARK
jgi:hypothetical protein